MEVLGEDLFVKLQEKMDFIPHTQSYGWLKYTIAKRNKSVIFFSNSIENTLICCWENPKDRWRINFLSNSGR